MFKAFAGTDLPDSKLRQAMIDDVVGMLDYYTWTQPSGIAALFTQRPVVRARRAPRQALRRAGVGRHGGAARAAGRTAAGPAHARAVPVDGLGEHAADHEGRLPAHERPVRHIPPPPPGANAKPPELGPNMTTRESVEELTEMPGTVCAELPRVGDQPARVRDRGLRRARALPHGAAPVRRGRHRDRDQGRQHDDGPAGACTAIRRASRRPPS